MWRLILLLFVASYAVAQTIVPMVDPDEANQHLIKPVPPKYPSLAQTARIQGNVVLEMDIDEAGRPKNIRVVRGHPMLITAALDAAGQCRYLPFEINGKPTEVRTFVLVQFGLPYPPNDQRDHADVLTRLGEISLSGGDFPTAQHYLDRASELLNTLKDEQSFEREEWLVALGRLYMAQKKYDEAEPNLRKALDLSKRRDPQFSRVRERLEWLAQLYTLENKYESARSYADQEVQTCEKEFRKSERNVELKQQLGTEIAYRSWMLTLLALQQNDHAEAVKRCHSVMDYQQYLGTSYHDQALATCQKELNPPAQ